MLALLEHRRLVHDALLPVDPVRPLPRLAVRDRPDAVAQSARNRGKHFLRSEEHTSELQSLMRISYAVFCLKKKTKIHKQETMQAETVYSMKDHYTHNLVN